jgi:hypothetical protein
VGWCAVGGAHFPIDRRGFFFLSSLNFVTVRNRFLLWSLQETHTHFSFYHHYHSLLFPGPARALYGVLGNCATPASCCFVCVEVPNLTPRNAALHAKKKLMNP